MVERVSSLPKYYVSIGRACTVCVSLQKQDGSFPMYFYKQLLTVILTVIFY